MASRLGGEVSLAPLRSRLPPGRPSALPGMMRLSALPGMMMSASLSTLGTDDPPPAVARVRSPARTGARWLAVFSLTVLALVFGAAAGNAYFFLVRGMLPDQDLIGDQRARIAAHPDAQVLLVGDSSLGNA